MLVWLLIIFFLLPIPFSLFRQPLAEKEIPLSEALTEIKEGRVKEVLVEDSILQIVTKEDKRFSSRKESTESFVKTLETAGIDPKTVTLKIKDTSIGRIWGELLINLLPIVGMGFLLFFLFRQARGAQDTLFSFGQSRAKLFARGKQNVTFKDVAGVPEAKKELEEVVDFLKHPQKYRVLGARTPKGALLIGPSGTGKTLLAKAVAGEAAVPFFSMAGSEFMEMLVGVGASRVRDLFGTAKKNAPSIIFIDEIDAIGRVRGTGLVGGHDEREQTLNQILVEMDGFTVNDNVVVLAATNRGDLLDPALRRPGRFDRTVVLDMPDIEGRKAILAIHAKGKPFAKEVDWEKVAKRTVGFSGADLENMLNEAAILAARSDKKSIEMDDIEEAATKVKLGPQRKRLQSDEDRKMTAYHEAGHAVVNYFSTHMDPVHRISIVARGMTLGHTMIPPTQDRTHETKTRLLEEIQVFLGGRAAEELVFSEMTTGAASDIDQATKIARQMVVDFGMSSLGPISWGPQMDTNEMGRAFFEPTQLSPEMQSQVDAEVKQIVDDCYQRTQTILSTNHKKLDKLAKELLVKETIEGEDFRKLMST
ncbi:ATP-dependent zinc metalloprotease FtsH [Candidatus Shapirobacteria bacterium]|nr:ATP-dependent zinc metalloprotease FtsH [Candidatus Shapirobacteria bacterium]